MRRLDCHDRVKGAVRRYQTALATIRVFIGIAEQHPEHLHQQGLDLAEIRAVAQELHDVYFMRMFAYFESSLRHYWRTNVRNTKPVTEQLFTSIAGRRGVPQDTLDVIHEIRHFRNYLVHENDVVGTVFTIADASKHLNTFLARLPLEW